MTRTLLALVILLTASCSDDLPASSTSPDDAAATDALARGEALGDDAGPGLAPDSGAVADALPVGAGGAGGMLGTGGSGGGAGAPATGAGGAGGSGGATSTGGAGGGGAGGAGGAAAYPTCMPPAGTTIESLVCRKLVGDTYKATRRDGFICATGCLAVTSAGKPAGYQGEPLHPACVYATGAGQAPEYICVGSCQGCQP
jgi:hypothetical protein